MPNLSASTALAAFTLSVAPLTGCAEGHFYNGHGYPYWHYHTPASLRGAAPEEEEDAIRAAYEPAYRTPAPCLTAPLPAPNVTPPDPVHDRFDGAAALAAIHAIDLSPCEARGARRTYVHARITFDREGTATRVLIDSPAGLSSDAMVCLGDRLALATAPAFDGGPLTVGASVFTAKDR